MSKGLANYPESMVMSVAMRRTNNSTHGCGYWGSIDYLNRKGIKTKEQQLTAQVSSIVAREEKQHERPQRPHIRWNPPSLSDQSKRLLASLKV